ncbi:MAG TPA: DHA2 family efflux MFS transporter permease subunit [Longimicrobium sp.]|nr:DHA2 family efflux MFS transporter permease subunit [Longimicrobium sp.]
MPTNRSNPLDPPAVKTRLQSTAGRWILAAAVLGSGAVFLESTVVNVALPSLARDLGLGMDGVQWVVNGYLLTLSALMLLGGALGDVYPRARVFALGALAFGAASLAAAVMPTLPLLVAARVAQGAAGALLVPNSLALLEESFEGDERGAAIGRWAAWSAVSTAAGPFAGGWVVDALSWRWVFAFVAPFAFGAAWMALRLVPAPRSAARRPIDFPGAALVTVALGTLVAVLVSAPRLGMGDPRILVGTGVGVAALAGFVVQEGRNANPLLPLRLFRSRQFSAVNLTTLLVYAAIGAVFLLLVLVLQNALGYTAFRSGLALLPLNAVMLLVSPVAGRLAGRIGPRAPMTVGALLAAGGLLLLSRLSADAGYVRGVLPGLMVFALGLSLLVAPLTAAVLGAVPDEFGGVASAVNNSVARVAGLLSTAALPAILGAAASETLAGAPLLDGFRRVLIAAAGLCVAGAATTFLFVRSGAKVEAVSHPSAAQGCTQTRAKVA